jgi:hypothetical protein
MSAKPFRLLDDFQAGYIKFNGREPRTLEELAIALADNEHSRRRAEIKAMRARLAMLDEFLPALAERGIKVWARDIHGHDRGKTLRIYPGVLVGNDDKLHAALLELGFREVERKSNHRNDTVTLQHGRWLVVSIDVSRAAAPATAETAGSAS